MPSQEHVAWGQKNKNEESNSTFYGDSKVKWQKNHEAFHQIDQYFVSDSTIVTLSRVSILILNFANNSEVY